MAACHRKTPRCAAWRASKFKRRDVIGCGHMLPMDCSFPRWLILLTKCNVPSLFAGIWGKVRIWTRVSSWFYWPILSIFMAKCHTCCRCGVNIMHPLICPDMSRQAAWPNLPNWGAMAAMSWPKLTALRPWASYAFIRMDLPLQDLQFSFTLVSLPTPDWTPCIEGKSSCRDRGDRGLAERWGWFTSAKIAAANVCKMYTATAGMHLLERLGCKWLQKGQGKRF